MGCSSSRAEDSPLVVLCRERRDLIRAAADNRYALASTHASYFRSLAGVGDALHRFVLDELSVAPSRPSSPVLTIPSSVGKRTAGGGNSSSSSSSSVTPLSHSLSPEGSHIHLSSSSNDESGDQGDRGYSASPRPQSVLPSPNYYYMRSSTGVPAMVYEDPYTGGRWPNSSYPGYSSDYGYGVPIGSTPAGVDDAYYTEMKPRAEAATPPPPPVEGSSWDFFNPFFGSYGQQLPEYYQGRYGAGSAMSSPNSSEVREQEGIPELEEDTEQEPVKEVRKGKKVVVDEDVGTSKAASVRAKKKGGEAVVVEEKESKSSSSEFENKPSSSSEKQSKSSSLGSKPISIGEEEVDTKRKGVSSDGESSLVTEESGPSDVNTLSTHGTRDVMEVVDEIKQCFKSAAGSGEEVARMLEVGRLPYQSGCSIHKAIYFRILDLMAHPPSTSSQPSFKRQRLSSANRLKNKISYYADFEKQISMKSGNLSSTLEKLYMWEKKLYKEVKDEEKLRIMYNKKWRQLKALDDRGEESHKIDSTRASIRYLDTKISVVIRSIDTISSRVHKIRNEELQPQLIELIQGFRRMWKSVLDCHQKQIQALVASKSHKLMAKTGVQKKTVAKATIELEMELLSWCSCFTDWISTQKDYVEALNGWLMKWLIQEQEMTPDGAVPFSPSRVGAPAAFIISNDWHHALKRISEAQVTEAMRSFAFSLHEMWENQNKEQQQKLKAEYLSRDLATRLKSLDIVLTADNSGGDDNAPMMALESLRKRLDEERVKHEETLQHIQQAASGCLRMGLAPIFEVLGNFTLEMVRAYEELRIPNEGEGT